ncbi:MAG: UTP--glucose-1-phosphate uridylyltransferase GalU [Burkholderiales bacterium]|jgi:UTP--glucose-1-phosphate uridylyltransferase|nr:UTP--glucose-1-phosphate uridylyltransferase GalU [Rhodocyclaceae bacterium]MCA3018619.1 UTP--glucose-1-phosphate uridylyltransferase GalU [Rhodocyclaceae bacterium]MCA3022879.1 UTP--glucose-1-phosphate uridylyltransferase GalU [Rhodocyclaceae bacterium]MCA3024815.1 UTP--glucose-1-phosphate uridylyltransferase GalU [Rhodocyclaceae bacterium]MCA3032359.1 UTP--glucose-1-phosphate uridylyltransferase GalU [Rhodocyclaceae bacterium]
MKVKKVTKAVFPVAGLGTRFLPATKASPKEMLPVVDKPLIQYAVEEAAAAGITEMIFVTGRGKRTIEDHFDKAYELEAELHAKGKQKLLHEVRNMLPINVQYVYVRQPEALGLGHAVLCAKHLVGDEAFAVILADDLIDAKVPVMRQMVQHYEQYAASVLGCVEVPKSEVSSYGIVDSKPVSKKRGERVSRMSGIVEKPKPEDAPSTLSVVGRYILTPAVFSHLEKIQQGVGKEIQLTDAIAALLKKEKVFAYEFEGTRYDCGSKLGYLQATVALGMKHAEVGKAFAEHVKAMSTGR